MTQAELAEAAGLHAQFVSQIEREDRTASIESIDRLAKALDVTPAELFADDQPRPATKADRVRALLAAWPEKDQDKLIKLLVELRRVAGPARAG